MSLEEARRIVEEFVQQYNCSRLHSAIGYVTPEAKLQGKEKQIFGERDRKLEEARARRAAARREANAPMRLQYVGNSNCRPTDIKLMRIFLGKWLLSIMALTHTVRFRRTVLA